MNNAKQRAFDDKQRMFTILEINIRLVNIEEDNIPVMLRIAKRSLSTRVGSH